MHANTSVAVRCRRRAVGAAVGAIAEHITYPERGATRTILPAGYNHLHYEVPIAAGHLAFTTATNALLTWQMHQAAWTSSANVPSSARSSGAAASASRYSSA